MHRFFVEPGQIQSGVVHFDEEISRQISKVLRLSSGCKVIVLDNTGLEHFAEIDQIDSRGCTAVVRENRPSPNEPGIHLELQLCLTQREKFEWMLQKCTEIGAGSFTPVISSRTLIQQPEEVRGKYPRWDKILREAAEQSGRGRIPVLNPPLHLTDLVERTNLVGLHLVAWEGEQDKSLKETLRNFAGKEISVLIGPEGGFATEEVNQLIERGYIPVSLGRRILRMETAAVAAAALILYELDEV